MGPVRESARAPSDFTGCPEDESKAVPSLRPKTMPEGRGTVQESQGQ